MNVDTMTDTARLSIDDKEIELPIVRGSEGEVAVDISKLRGQSGVITLDRGFKNTGSTTSAITFLNGEEGILRYRGYSIEDLAENTSFMEVAYLLVYGDLPDGKRLKWFEDSIRMHTLVHENMKRFFDAFPLGAHPMGMLSAMSSTLSTFYPDSQDPNRSMEDIDMTCHRLIAKLPTLAAQCYKHNMGHPMVYPANELSYTENFLYMMFGLPTEDYEIDPIINDAINKLLILHADHEQNCSTSTVRVVGSSQANLYSSVAAGISALWGPLHGGANQAVIEMLEQIKADGGDHKKYIEKAKDKTHFENLTPLFPDRRFILESDPENMTMRILDLVSPKKIPCRFIYGGSSVYEAMNIGLENCNSRFVYFCGDTDSPFLDELNLIFKEHLDTSSKAVHNLYCLD